MQEREAIRVQKETGAPKPWSNDPVFQTTYFCNVNRENDRVTKFIRRMYSPHVNDPMFEVNIGFARIINEPGTLAEIGYIGSREAFAAVGDALITRQTTGKRTFGDAYIVSTNGRPVAKAYYVAQALLPALYEGVGPGLVWANAGVAPTCAAAYTRYMGVYGISSFMAGQNIADLKNTPGHALYDAADRKSWSCSGPGSLRGLSWIFSGSPNNPVKKAYQANIEMVHTLLGQLGNTVEYDMQDLQNCLCEFDKYMRVSTGTGRSKRSYPGDK
jgi:hypothetical protein